ncbi:MAG: hypothetical protein LBN33_03000 [Desulfovibrio sp.]|jgi:predicted CopG family antitoxin|nr:hypothetical protein [Desulfovibrio sp.]
MSTDTNIGNGAKRTREEQNRAREASRKRGRPIKIFLSADEFAQLEAMKNGTSLNFSEVIRRLIVSKQFVIRDASVLIFELKRQGGLLKHTASEIFSEHMDLGRELAGYGREIMRIVGEIERMVKYDIETN